jgi:hypothetical protein
MLSIVKFPSPNKVMGRNYALFICRSGKMGMEHHYYPT